MSSECRLCGVIGRHEVDIWDEGTHDTEFTLSERIFECIGLPVSDFHSEYLHFALSVESLTCQLRVCR